MEETVLLFPFVHKETEIKKLQPKTKTEIEVQEGCMSCLDPREWDWA